MSIFQFFQFQNENNMPSYDGITHENIQFPILINTILNIPQTRQKENRLMLKDEYQFYETNSSKVE